MKRVTKKRVTFHAELRNVKTCIANVKSASSASPQGVTSQQTNDTPVEPPATDTRPPHVLDELMKDLQLQVEQLSAARAENLEELHEVVVELSLVVASHIVKRELEAERLNLNEIVGAAIEELVPATQITVRVNPADSVDLESLESEHATNLQSKIQLVNDATLPRGSCLVTNEEQGLLSTLEARLENIRDTLLQGIDYARIERRKTGEFGESLRRFPDRRKLA